jgi:hypothetical protein
MAEHKRRGSMVGQVLIMLTAMYLGMALLYAAGGAGARLGVTGSLDFQRELDWQLWEADGRFGYYRRVSPLVYDDFSVVSVERVSPPLCWVCGGWTWGREVLSSPRYRMGDWLYGAYTFAGHPVAWNVVTGEELMSERTSDRAEGDFSPPRVEDEPVFVRMGFLFDPSLELRWDDLEKRPLPTLNDSCYVLHMAFWALYVLVGLGAGVAWVVRRVRGGGEG